MNWNDVKVSQLPEIQKLIELNPSDAVDLMDRDIALLSIFTGKSEDWFNSLKANEFGEWRKRLYELISTQPSKDFTPLFNIGGRVFVTEVSPKNVTAAQLADIHLLQINPKNYYSKVPYILAVFSEEKRGLMFWRKKLTFTEKVELFKSLPADTANSISLFFCKVLPTLEAAIRNSLESKITNNVHSLIQALQDHQRGSVGDGSKRSTNSRMATSQKRKPI
jgi:hypothetical protein